MKDLIETGSEMYTPVLNHNKPLNLWNDNKNTYSEQFFAYFSCKLKRYELSSEFYNQIYISKSDIIHYDCMNVVFKNHCIGNQKSNHLFHPNCQKLDTYISECKKIQKNIILVNINTLQSAMCTPKSRILIGFFLWKILDVGK